MEPSPPHRPPQSLPIRNLLSKRKSADPEGLERALGYSFADKTLLIRALTHRSRAYEQSPVSGPAADNEQLEFLGDSILGFIVSDYLLAHFPSFREGQFSVWKARIVSAANLAQVARRIQLGDFLVLGKGEQASGGRSKGALLSDAIEALIAAVYLDGGMDAARTLVERLVIGNFNPSEAAENVNAKTALQEKSHALGLPLPRYVVLREEGPPHERIFTVEARIGTRYTSTAQGLSKKSASQSAAELLLTQLEREL
ncbi:MAG: ribonuclease III [Bryobacterales bacterium]|nr:ribonuclease III [Bryobacterales bacterium]MEB2363419.1 ribonuclease III [Bryobacterales bacterium]